MIDLTSFQTAWSEYSFIMSQPVKYLGDLLIMGVAFVVMYAFFRNAGLEKKMVASLVSLGIIVAGLLSGIMLCVAVLKTHGVAKPDSFGTVISERYGLGSLSCKDSGSTNDLYMKADIPSSGNYACTGRDADDTDHIYTDLTLVVDGNKVGLYDKDGNLFKAGER